MIDKAWSAEYVSARELYIQPELSSLLTFGKTIVICILSLKIRL